MRELTNNERGSSKLFTWGCGLLFLALVFFPAKWVVISQYQADMCRRIISAQCKGYWGYVMWPVSEPLIVGIPLDAQHKSACRRIAIRLSSRTKPKQLSLGVIPVRAINPTDKTQYFGGQFEGYLQGKLPTRLDPFREILREEYLGKNMEIQRMLRTIARRTPVPAHSTKELRIIVKLPPDVTFDYSKIRLVVFSEFAGALGIELYPNFSQPEYEMGDEHARQRGR